MFSPLEQFEVTPLFYLIKLSENFNLPVTNFLVFTLLFFLFIVLGFSFLLRGLTLIPSSGQFLVEFVYDFIYDVLYSNVGLKGVKFFPFIFSLFFFILTFNLFGLFPYSFTITSQLVVMFVLAFSIFLGLFLITLFKHRLNTFALFFPTEAPIVLAFLLVPIEIVSFFSRPFSLAIRLFANMTAGHVLLKILTTFSLVALSYLTGLFIPFSFHLFTFKEVLLLIFSPVYVDFFPLDLNSLVLVSSAFKFTESFSFLTRYIKPVSYVLLNLFDISGNFPLNFFFDFSFLLEFIGVFKSSTLFNVFFLPSVNSFLFIKCSFFPFIIEITFLFSFFNIIFNFLLDFLLISLILILLLSFFLLEFFIAVLQAYVFTILTVIYLKNALELH